ncbi:winged helix-turn-helix transcriptional regulator [Rhizobium lusitanum]|nr:winged helix-turn-helix transcriptional regulator [Rhizobium lusitanum]
MLSAMANPIRLSILIFLADEEFSVNAIASHMGISGSSTSQHLAKLRTQRLVTARKERQVVYYSCHSKAAHALLRTLDDI